MNDRIVKRAKELGLRQQDIANRLKTSKSTVSKWFNGLAKPNGENLVQLAKVLDTSTEWLLNGRLEFTIEYETKEENGCLEHKIKEEKGLYDNQVKVVNGRGSVSQKVLIDVIQRMIKEGKMTDQMAEALTSILQSVE